MIFNIPSNFDHSMILYYSITSCFSAIHSCQTLKYSLMSASSNWSHRRLHRDILPAKNTSIGSSDYTQHFKGHRGEVFYLEFCTEPVQYFLLLLWGINTCQSKDTIEGLLTTDDKDRTSRSSLITSAHKSIAFSRHTQSELYTLYEVSKMMKDTCS